MSGGFMLTFCFPLLPVELSRPKSSSRIDDPAFCQPICTALQVALVDLLTSWHVFPHAIAGHSSGEVAAAYAAGAISREAAWKVAYHRGRLSAKLARSESRPKTGMAAVGLDKAGTEAAIDRVNRLSGGGDGTLEIACMNSADSHTVSGDVRKIRRLVEMLGEEEEKVFVRRLNVDVAYHSQYMRAVADEYLLAMGDLEKGTPKSPYEPRFYSSTMGAPMALSQLRRPDYWVKNLVSPVRFAESVTEMLKGSPVPKVKGHVNGHVREEATVEPITDFLEIGPHSALRGPLSSTAKQVRGSSTVDYHSVLRRQKPAVETTLEAIGALFCHGHGVDLARVNEADEPPGPRPLMLTNLPSYPFDHSKEYWLESALSSGFRKRSAGRHELLGAPVPGFNPDNAAWHNYIRLTESPWIEDHRVSGDVLYPAAGMLVMAVEASRQVAEETKGGAGGTALRVRGFRFRDVSFKLALRVPDDAGGVETQFYLRRYRESSLSDGGPLSWHEFQLWTRQDDKWREHCHGFVKTEYEADDDDDDDHVLPGTIEDVVTSDNNPGCATDSEEVISVERLYRNLSDSGLEFGPTFQTLSNVRVGKHLDMTATVDSPGERVKEMMPCQYLQPHLVHPATLDAVVHASLVPVVSGDRDPRSTRVPTYLSDGWISARHDLPHDAYAVSAECEMLGRNEVSSEVTATHPRRGHTMVHLSGLVFRTLSDGPRSKNDARDTSSSVSSAHPAFNLIWKPDPLFLDGEQASKLFELPVTQEEDDPGRWMEDCEALCLAYIRRAVKDVARDTVDKMAWHHQRYFSWFQHVVRQSSNEPPNPSDDNDDDEVNKLEARVVASGAPEGKLIVAVGHALADILAGDRDPLDVIFADRLAEDVYSNGLGSRRCYAQLSRYVDALAHANPAMSILEIGAGTGGATRPIMATLTGDGVGVRDGVGVGIGGGGDVGPGADVGPGNGAGRRYKHYDFTDISPSFFEQAKETFRGELAHMDFRVLNVEKDPRAQGFEAGRYDVVVAANVLHATRSVDETLRHARTLLKPDGGGRLLLFEITNTEVLLGSFCFGVLPGWWLSEDADRVWGPLMSPASWHRHLVSAGFSGVDAVFDDFPSSPHQMSSVLVSSTAPRPDQVIPAEISTTTIFILAGETPAQRKLAEAISQTIIGRRGPCDITTVSAVASRDVTGSTCIVLCECEKPLLRDMTERVLEGVKRVLTQGRVVLWVTRGGTATAPDPDSEMITGLARVIRSERPDAKLLTASFEAAATDELVADRCAQILHRAAHDTSDNSFRVGVDGVIHVPRLVPAEYLRAHVEAQTGPLKVVDRPLINDDDDNSRPLALQIGNAGQLDSLRFEDDSIYKTPLGDHDVEFQPMACGLSVDDLSSALGTRTSDKPTLGFEASGVVTRAGPSSRFQAGDRVFGLCVSGAVKTRVRSRDGLLAKLPDGVSWAHGAALPVDYTTAYAVLCEFEPLRRGDAVLVQGAASTLGRALIWMAQLQGAEVYATVDGQAERDALVDACGISRDRLLGTTTTGDGPPLKSSLQKLTKGRGINVLVNCCSAGADAAAGASLDGAAGCVAPFGRIVSIGSDIPQFNSYTNLLVRGRNVRIESFDLAACAFYDLPRTETLFQRMVDLVFANWSSGVPFTVSVYPFSQVRAAFRQLQSGAVGRRRHTSKVVLAPHARDVVPVLSDRKAASSAVFDPEASYVVAGGLGGLGRSVARWMASRGARNLILLSRRGGAVAEKPAIDLVRELESLGVDNVATPACDVADEEALRRVLTELAATMPPIKGCIQGCMVLQDNLFENMSVDEWKAATLPKVDGSENLCSLLADTVDFVVFLSSVVGLVGNPEQANYAAACALQDALARRLAARGVNAVSVDLPIVEGVGYVAEKPGLRNHLRSAGWTHISEAEFHAVLDYHCRPAARDGLGPHTADVARAQVVPRLWLPRETAVEGRQTPSWSGDPLFSHLGLVETGEGGKTEDDDNGAAATAGKTAANHGALLQGASSREEVAAVVLEALLLKTARMLGVGAANLEPSRPLHAYGIDSLTAVELRSWLAKELGADVSVFEVTDSSSIAQLAAVATKKSRLAPRFGQSQ
ncbi:Lovastatin diketide synthase LovF [Colletotrichum tanaceti]|nr:Lovastatin diketide synthase LovF [Colletotrichum tanaceti]